ncbi:MAG: CDP-diacylglycerol--glycerol-3-phosphate 3-phosphatidyltransferase [Actinomycetota bacterium]
MNIPNLITIARIALVPIFIWLLAIEPSTISWQRFLAIFFFVLAASTDGLDGMIARRTNKVTNLGKILDPIADKALIGGALIVLSILGEIDWWVTILILVREIGITLYRIAVVKREVISATLSGKLKTIFQAVAIGCVMAPFETWIPLWSYLELSLIYLALAATLISGYQFLRAATKK